MLVLYFPSEAILIVKSDIQKGSIDELKGLIGKNRGKKRR